MILSWTISYLVLGMMTTALLSFSPSSSSGTGEDIVVLFFWPLVLVSLVLDLGDK